MHAVPPVPTPEGLDRAREFLRHHIAQRPRRSRTHLPGLQQVWVTHVEDGWVELRFSGYDTDQAKALADALPLPDSVLVDDSDLSCAFEGFAALDDVTDDT